MSDPSRPRFLMKYLLQYNNCQAQHCIFKIKLNYKRCNVLFFYILLVTSNFNNANQQIYKYTGKGAKLNNLYDQTQKWSVDWHHFLTLQTLAWTCIRVWAPTTVTYLLVYDDRRFMSHESHHDNDEKYKIFSIMIIEPFWE